MSEKAEKLRARLQSRKEEDERKRLDQEALKQKELDDKVREKEEKRERLTRKLEEKKKLDIVKKATTALEEDKKKLNQQANAPVPAVEKPINTRRSDTMIKKQPSVAGGLPSVRGSKGGLVVPPQKQGSVSGTTNVSAVVGDENSVADMSVEGRQRAADEPRKSLPGGDDSYLDDYQEASFVEEEE